MLRNRRTLLILLVCLMVFTGAVAILVADREPSYQGRLLSEWLAAYQKDVELPYNTQPVEWMGRAPTPQQVEAAAAVRHIGIKAIPFLLKRLQYEGKRPKWKDNLYRRVCLLPDSKATRYLRAKLYPVRDYEIRGAAFLGFALLGDKADSAIPALLRLAEDPDPHRTHRALGVLSCLGQRGLHELFTLAADPQSPNQLLAIRQFAGMRHCGTNASPAVPILVRRAADPDPEIAWEAIYGLCNLGLEFDLCFPVFTNAITSTNKQLLISTLHHLGYFGHPEVLRRLAPSLLSCLSDPDTYVRLKAIETLTYIAPETVLRSPDPQTKLLALNYLAMAGTGLPEPQISPHVRACLNDPDQAVRRAATNALTQVENDTHRNPVRNATAPH